MIGIQIGFYVGNDILSLLLNLILYVYTALFKTVTPPKPALYFTPLSHYTFF